MKKVLRVSALSLLLLSSAGYAERIVYSGGEPQINVTLGENPRVNVGYTEERTYRVHSGRHHRPRLLKPTWINMYKGAAIPPDAVAGGGQPQGRETLYVCRVNYRGGVHPGKLHDGACNFGWGGKEVVKDQYEILVSQEPLRFVAGSYGSKPSRAVVGGYQHDGTFYVCRAQYEGGMHPGKLYKGNCNIGWGGDEIAVPYYEVLTQ